jgi:hypothetical protein
MKLPNACSTPWASVVLALLSVAAVPSLDAVLAVDESAAPNALASDCMTAFSMPPPPCGRCGGRWPWTAPVAELSLDAVAVLLTWLVW